MITLNTNDKELVAELFDDEKRAIYMFRKACGGRQRYEKMRDEMLARSESEKKNQKSAVVEYTGPTGNKWRMFEYCRYYEQSRCSYTEMYSFVYYETYGSCGAFLPVSGVDGKKSVMIFTSHFFERMCARLGITFQSSEMIERFVEMVPLMIVQPHEEFYGSMRRVSVGLPGSIGKGVIRCEDPNVIEIRTYLTNKSLSNKQKKDVEKLHQLQKDYRYEPGDIKLARLLNLTKDDLAAETNNTFCRIGIPEHLNEYAYNMYNLVTHILMIMRIISYKAFLSERLQVIVGVVIAELVTLVHRYDTNKEINQFYEVLLLLRKCSKKLGRSHLYDEGYAYWLLNRHMENSDDNPLKDIGITSTLNEYEKRMGY